MKNILTTTLLLGLFNSLFGEALIEYDYELDAYYSNASIFIDLDNKEELTDASSLSEYDIYENLFLNTFNPNIFLIEASINPMPVLGLYARKQNEHMYVESRADNFNVIKSVTAGFEEPYSLSFFVGRMMIFKNDRSDNIGKNRAYMGYLVSVGDYSIKDNLAHYDKWINIEFKLKGTREKDERDLDWSFRIGTKIHTNKDFSNSLYIGARRSSIDYKQSAWSIVYNSAFTAMVAVSADTYKLTESEFMIEKKWPLSWGDKTSFGLGLGYLYYSGNKYAGALQDEGVDNHQVLIRPNLKF